MGLLFPAFFYRSFMAGGGRCILRRPYWFYTDNFSRGVFPLWDPSWYGGAPYHFFLRRIGDVNPFLLLIVLLKWFGVSSAASYVAFIAAYYFLAGSAFYLITRIILQGRFYAFTAYVLLLFSSWGSEIFYNYIIIIFVPIIWFFYFLLCFARSAQRGHFLGMCFCVGLIVTTYIPFFFLTILTLFIFLFILFYGRDFAGFLRRCYDFWGRNRIFTVFCVFFLLVSCVPALVFYKESKSGEFTLPNRHSGADVASAVSVGLDNVTSGDIISHGYFDRLFDDHKNINMGDIYIPFIFFLVLLVSIGGRINKLIFFLLFNILGLSLITITSVAGVHHFLYQHIIFFKFIRNIYYFFWLGMLPMGILLSVAALGSVLTAIDHSSRKKAWLINVIICHFIFIVFLLGHQGVLWGAWAAIGISLLYFLVYFFCDKKISYLAGYVLFLLSIFIQSAQVYGCLGDKLFKTQKEITDFSQTQNVNKPVRLDLYYASRWFDVLVNYIDPGILDNYRKTPFIMYDNVLPYDESAPFFKAFESSIASHVNVAYVSRTESEPGDWRKSPDAGGQADMDPASSGKLSITHSDVNTWILKTRLPYSQFLVINDNYNTDWHALINGHPARLLRANVSFKGLWVPSGESRIVLRYSNPRRYALHFLLILLFAGTFLYLLSLLKKHHQTGPYA
jgi:hypothetical protein